MSEAVYLESEAIYDRVVEDGILVAERSIWIATANVKDLHLRRRGRPVSIVRVLGDRLAQGLDIRLLHSSIPSGPFLEDLGTLVLPAGRVFPMRRCPRVHFKTVIVDGHSMFVGSANLTGAGMGAKSAYRRNFEVGLWITDSDLIDRVQSLFNLIWEGEQCGPCGRRDVCYVPLEQPDGASGCAGEG
jgi:phosphatidylserine/phosphatidylglycerophosphate/cardiolipin synthase-like enzyme